MLGLEVLAARTYVVNIVMFGYLFCIAISQGGAISVGHLVGKAKYRGAFILGKYVMRLALRFLSSLTGNLLNMCHGKRGIVVRNNITASTVMAMARLEAGDLVIGLAISGLLCFGAVPILKLMGLDDNLLKEGIGYMQIVGLFAFFQALSLTLSATLRASFLGCWSA